MFLLNKRIITVILQKKINYNLNNKINIYDKIIKSTEDRSLPLLHNKLLFKLSL